MIMTVHRFGVNNYKYAMEQVYLENLYSARLIENNVCFITNLAVQMMKISTSKELYYLDKHDFLSTPGLLDFMQTCLNQVEENLESSRDYDADIGDLERKNLSGYLLFQRVFFRHVAIFEESSPRTGPLQEGFGIARKERAVLNHLNSILAKPDKTLQKFVFCQKFESELSWGALEFLVKGFIAGVIGNIFVLKYKVIEQILEKRSGKITEMLFVYKKTALISALLFSYLVPRILDPKGKESQRRFLERFFTITLPDNLALSALMVAYQMPKIINLKYAPTLATSIFLTGGICKVLDLTRTALAYGVDKVFENTGFANLIGPRDFSANKRS